MKYCFISDMWNKRMRLKVFNSYYEPVVLFVDLSTPNYLKELNEKITFNCREAEEEIIDKVEYRTIKSNKYITELIVELPEVPPEEASINTSDFCQMLEEFISKQEKNFGKIELEEEKEKENEVHIKK